MKLKRTRELKLMLLIWLLISNCWVFDIDTYCHCLREKPEDKGDEGDKGKGATGHMWQTRTPTDPLADTGSCNRPTTLGQATDSDGPTSQLNANGSGSGSGNATVQQAASPAVTLANYVYQCAAKRTESTPSKPSTISSSSNSSSIDLAKSKERHEQQMTVPAIVLQLAKSWQFN